MIQLPDQTVPVIDPRTGLMTPEWYSRLVQLVAALNTLL